jgi:lysophospholipase L1-like esterase
MFRPLWPRHLLLVIALLRGAPGTEAAENFAKWEKEIAAYEQRDRESPPPPGGIVFVGSSSIRLWSTLATDFPKHRVLNRGVGGSQIVDATHFADRIIFPYAPRMIVLYAGGNDLNAGKSPEQVVADFRAFVAKVRARLPEVKIAYISIAGNPARWAQVEKVKAANARIAELAKEIPRLEFINVFPHMLGEDGLPRPEIFVEDRLHMNAEGYKIWKRVVGPFLPEPDAIQAGGLKAK